MKVLNLTDFKKLVVRGGHVSISEVVTMDLSGVPEGYVPYLTGEPLRVLLRELVLDEIGSLAMQRLERLRALDGPNFTLSGMVAAIVKPMIDRLATPEGRLLQLACRAINNYQVNLPQSLWWTGFAQKMLNRHLPPCVDEAYRYSCRDCNILLYMHAAQNIYATTVPLQGSDLRNAREVMTALTYALLSVQRS
ncbi:MAG: hypothetical protein EA402_04735 [Planctomycetota bacterium]|nr:MAG: hypothetical protein EA402_04735 [Planctomycetota bacterium]